MLSIRRAAAFLAVFLAFPAAWADPPKLTIPAEVRPAGEFVVLIPDTDAVSVTYIGLDGFDAPPPGVFKDDRTLFLSVYGRKAQAYRFAAVASSATGEQKRVDFRVVVGEAVPPPVVPPPVVPPPVVPPPVVPPPVVPAGSPYVLIVRANGSASREFTKAMEDKAWLDLKAAGIAYRDLSFDDSKAIYSPPAGTALPYAVPLRVFADGKSEVVAPPVPFPTAPEGIRKLKEFFK